MSTTHPAASAATRWERLGWWILAWRRPILVGTVVLTAFMGFHAFQVRMTTSFGDLVPYRHPFVDVHTRYAQQFGGANSVVVMVEAREGTIFTAPILGKILEITQAVDRLPGVNHDQIESIGHRATHYLKVQAGMVSLPPVMRRAPQSDAEVEEIRAVVHHSENLYGTLVSLDDKAALIRAGFIEGKLDYATIFRRIDDEIVARYQDAQVAISVAGEPRLYGWIYHYADELTPIFLAAVAILWALLYAYFRDWRGALRPTITGGLSALWGLGFMHLIGFALDPLSLVIPFFVTARAVSHSVQMHDRYYEEYARNGARKEPAIVAAFATLFVPTLSGIVTDVLGMLVIALVPVVVLQRIAVSAAFWVGSVVVSELLLNPVVYYYLRAPELARVEARRGDLLHRAIAFAATRIVSARGRWVSLAAWAVVVVGASTQLRHLTVGDPTAASPLLWPDSPYNQAHERIQQEFGGVEPLIVVVEGKDDGALQEPQVLERMEDFQRDLERDPSVGSSFSLADVVRAVHMTFYDLQPRWSVIPAERSKIGSLFFYFFANQPPSETTRFVDPAFRTSHVTFFCRDHQGDNVRRIIERARAFIAAHPMDRATFRLAGGLIGITAAANEEILRNDLLMNLLGFGTIFVTVVVTYRSVYAGVLALVGLVMANVVVNAYMGWRNIGVNVQSLPVVTVGVGFGVDYALYVISRAIEERRAGRDLRSALESALRTAGGAVTFTVLALVCVTLPWTFSRIRFDAEMGLLLALWMAVSFLASVTLLPAILLTRAPRFLAADAVGGGGPSPGATPLEEREAAIG